MILKEEEFQKIRPLEWTIREYGGELYNTLTNETDTRLFWYDFMRFVFAPKFSRQWGVTRIQSFDQTQPVLIDDNLSLRLPTELETAAYYADNTTLPMSFALPFTQTTVISALFLLATMFLLYAFYSGRGKNSRGA